MKLVMRKRLDTLWSTENGMPLRVYGTDEDACEYTIDSEMHEILGFPFLDIMTFDRLQQLHLDMFNKPLFEYIQFYEAIIMSYPNEFKTVMTVVNDLRNGKDVIIYTGYADFMTIELFTDFLFTRYGIIASYVSGLDEKATETQFAPEKIFNLDEDMKVYEYILEREKLYGGA